MKILLCCEYYSPSVGGVQEVMRQLAERLVLKGFAVSVATGRHARRERISSIRGVTVHSFGVTGNAVSGLRGDVASYRSFLLDQKFDVILINAAQQWTFDAALDVLPRLASKLYFIPCGFSGLGHIKYRSYYEQMPHWLDLFDGLIFATQHYQDYAFATKKSTAACHLIPNGVDEREFADLDNSGMRQQLGLANGDHLLLDVGSLLRAKGHWEALLAYAAADLPSQSVLVINGNTHPKRPLVMLFKFLADLARGRFPLSFHLWLLSISLRRQGKRVLLLDLPRKSLLSLYKAADLFVFPSHVEYSPLVLFEAAASSTPFVASIAGNSQEIAMWTKAGITVPAASQSSAQVHVSALSLAISTLLRDPVRLKRMAHEGREAIFARGLTWSDLADRYAELLLGRI